MGMRETCKSVSFVWYLAPQLRCKNNLTVSGVPAAFFKMLHSYYWSNTVNSKLFISKISLQIKWKSELQHEAIVLSFDV